MAAESIQVLEPSEDIQDPVTLRAPQSLRLINALLDVCVSTILSYAILRLSAELWPITFGHGDEVPVAFHPMTLAIYGAYCFSMESLWSRTLGKFVTGTRVVGLRGQPSWPRLLIRTLLRFFPLEALSFYGPYPLGLHDKWSGTRVVKGPVAV
ncbi:MAG: RDD family protein [Myxococcota bacterium]